MQKLAACEELEVQEKVSCFGAEIVKLWLTPLTSPTRPIPGTTFGLVLMIGAILDSIRQGNFAKLTNVSYLSLAILR